MPRYQISLKSVQWKPSFSMRTDGRRDVTKLIVAFRNFAKAPKNGLWLNFILWISSKICRNITLVVFIGHL